MRQIPLQQTATSKNYLGAVCTLCLPNDLSTNILLNPINPWPVTSEWCTKLQPVQVSPSQSSRCQGRKCKRLQEPHSGECIKLCETNMFHGFWRRKRWLLALFCCSQLCWKPSQALVTDTRGFPQAHQQRKSNAEANSSRHRQHQLTMLQRNCTRMFGEKAEKPLHPLCPVMWYAAQRVRRHENWQKFNRISKDGSNFQQASVPSWQPLEDVLRLAVQHKNRLETSNRHLLAPWESFINQFLKRVERSAA